MNYRFLLLLMILSISCEKSDQDQHPEFFGTLTDGFCLVIGDSLAIAHTQIDCYDLSTHIIYLKDEHEFFGEDHKWDAAFNRFTVYADRDSIYSGALWPMWSSSIYEGLCIHWPSFLPAYAIQINQGYPGFYDFPKPSVDPRRDPRILEALIKYDQLKQGLSCTLDQIEAQAGGGLSFTFTVTNLDDTNYYILSPDRMGMELFHYFTNGLLLHSERQAVLQHRCQVEEPEPWDSWSSSWFDLLEGKQSKSFQIAYADFDPIPEGSYEASFVYPGLSQVTIGEIHRTNGRIWLGGIRVKSEITFK